MTTTSESEAAGISQYSMDADSINNNMLDIERDIKLITNCTWSAEIWPLIDDICEKINSSSQTNEWIQMLMHQLSCVDNQKVLATGTLMNIMLDKCKNNFRQDFAWNFTTDFVTLIKSRASYVNICNTLKYLLKLWAKDYEGNRRMSLIPKAYEQLCSEGYDFSQEVKLPFTFKKINPITYKIITTNVEHLNELLRQKEKGSIGAIFQLSNHIKHSKLHLAKLKNGIQNKDFQESFEIQKLISELEKLIQEGENEIEKHQSIFKLVNKKS